MPLLGALARMGIVELGYIMAAAFRRGYNHALAARRGYESASV